MSTIDDSFLIHAAQKKMHGFFKNISEQFIDILYSFPIGGFFQGESGESVKILMSSTHR
jgi:hypothetical protein